jgi:hypothetical protein
MMSINFDRKYRVMASRLVYSAVAVRSGTGSMRPAHRAPSDATVTTRAGADATSLPRSVLVSTHGAR